jgi:eukaryotic-like serine/threonine-protein kinase
LADRRDELETALSGRYRIERELGRGGMATVYLAHDVRQERPVALKVLHAELAAALGPERFLREIKLTANLRHPHILPLFDSGEAAGQLWYTMPYVEGESLRQRLSREGRLSLEQTLGIADDVLAALSYAHGHGIVHRDIKPENILLEGGEAVLADFGIAQALTAAGSERLTGMGLAVGTPAYMSPEQAAGDTQLDGRSDLYSLGCVLYECVTGEPPFTGPSPHAVVAKHLTAPAPVVAYTLVPARISQAITKAMAKGPDERFATAGEFSTALGTKVSDKPAARRLPLILAAVVVLLLLGLTFYAGRRIAPSRPAAGGSIASGLNRKLTQITFGEGVEEWPAWSPDGTRLAYVAETDGLKQLFVRTLSTGAEQRVSHFSGDNIQPAWSPDGRRLAFVRASTVGGKLEPTDINGWFDEGGDIWSVELDGGRETQLVQSAFDPSYSPDGTRLAFDASWAGARRIWIADSTGRNPRQVTSDSSEAVVHTSPRWSPDGTKLVFRRIEKIKSDIVVVDLNTQALTRITDDYVPDMDPVWGPDGRSIYFSSSRGGGLNLWRTELGSGGTPVGAPQQLTTGAGDDVEPTVAPNGSRLAFAVRGINSDLWRLPMTSAGESAGPPQPLVSTTRVESRGSWSPDGKAIAFNSDRLGEMNIWVRNKDDSTARQLTRGPGGDYQPNWSPDGRSIAFFSARSGNADIWTVQLADGRLTQLTQDPATDTNPFYSPDGHTIAFLSDRSGRSEVWVMGADGSNPRRLTSIGAGGHFLRWMPDGRSIVFRAEAGTQVQIYRIDVADGTLTRLRDVSSGAHMSFSPDQSMIMDVQSHKTLWVYPVNGGPARQVFGFADPDVRIDYPTWSPDGKWLLFDRAAPKGGDLWLIEGAPQSQQ